MMQSVIRKFRQIILFFLIVILTGTFGCAKIGVNMSGPWVSRLLDKVAVTKSAKVVKEGIASHILMVTALCEMSPNNYRLLKECSYLYCSYGLFVEDEDPEFARELYTIGKEYGIRALKTNSKFRKGIESGKKISEMVGVIKNKKYAPALCWTALNSGLLIMLNLDDPGALVEMADISAVIKRSITLDGNYFFGAGKLFLGAYYGLLPEFLGIGGGPENSEKMFAEARKITNGKFLLVDLFEAKYLAITIDDEDLFEERLESIIAADVSDFEEARLINELAKMKAKFYLAHQDEYF